MNTRIRLIILFFGPVLFLSSTQASAQLNLDSCQLKALNNYPMIKQYDLIEQTKELTLSNANKNYLPKLDLTIIGGIVDGFPSFAPPGSEASSSVEGKLIGVGQLSQVIWDGGMTKASKGIIEANSEIEKADLRVNLYQLEERVNNLYFGVLLIDEQIAQMKILLENLERNHERIEVAIENGTAFRSDGDELKVEIINVEQKREELEFNKQSYTQVLALLIGENIDPTTSFIRPTFGLETDSLVLNRPELLRFEKQRQMIEAQSKLNKASLFPKIGLLGFGVFINPGIEFGSSDVSNLLIAGLSLSWSLDPLYKNGNNKKITQLNLQRVQNQQETFLFNTNLELSQTEMELDKYSKLIEQDQEIVQLKSSIKDAYVVKYDNGISTMSQMLDKINDENVAKQKLIMHEIQYLMKAYQYLNKSGN